MTGFRKIQSRQIDFTDFQTNNRLGIFIVDVKNSNDKNSIFIERYDAIGNIDPVLEFGTTEDLVDLTIEWEGVSTIWDGIIRVNNVIIDRSNPNAEFEAIPDSRRFRLILKDFDVSDEQLEEITVEVLNENLVSLSESITRVIEYPAVNITDIRFEYGVLNGEQQRATSLKVSSITERNNIPTSERFIGLRVGVGTIGQYDYYELVTDLTNSGWQSISQSEGEEYRGTPKVYDEISDRDAIPTNERYNGLIVVVEETNEYFKLHKGTSNSNWVLINSLQGLYPRNLINTTSITPELLTQTTLKEGDWVKVSVTFDDSVSSIIVYDETLTFFETTETEIILDESTDNYFLYLQVRRSDNLSNVSISLQGLSVTTQLLGTISSTNESGDNLNMFEIVNINNVLPSGSSDFEISLTNNSALDHNHSGVLTYNLSTNTYWNFPQLTPMNPAFSLNILAFNEEIGITLKPTVNQYNLSKQFVTNIINSVNGKTANISSTVPIASVNPTLTFNTKSLPSQQSHNLVLTSNQVLNTNTAIAAINANIVPPDSNISIISGSEDYISNNQIKVDVQVNDTHTRGTLTLTFTDVRTTSGRLLTTSGNYTVRGFNQRDLTGVVGQNWIFLGVPILDEVGWNAILVNNGSPMNYKLWNGGAVLSTPAMTNTTGLSPSDQYAYTYNPSNRRIILSQYIVATLLNNAAVVRISKT